MCQLKHHLSILFSEIFVLEMDGIQPKTCDQASLDNEKKSLFAATKAQYYISYWLIVGDCYTPNPPTPFLSPAAQ